MPPDLAAVLPAAAGLAVVLGGTLLFRLHALLSLALGGLVTAYFAPIPTVIRAETAARAERFAVRGVGEEAKGWSLHVDPEWGGSGNLNLYRRFDRVQGGVPTNTLLAFRPSAAEKPGTLGWPVAVLHRDLEANWAFRTEIPAVDGVGLVRTGWGDFYVRPFARDEAADTPPSDYESIHPTLWDPAAAPGAPGGLLEPGDWLVPPAELSAAQAAADRPAADRLAAAFGTTAAGIGLLIAFAAVLGAGLLHSGAAERLVRTLLEFVGPRGRPAAFCAGGFALGVPVFFDAVFLLCAPLAKSAALKTGGNYWLLILAVACGGAMTHSLVPPTPGPLLVAAELGVSLPAMVAAGAFVSVLAAPAGLLWAWWWTRRLARQLGPPAVRDSAGAELSHLRQLADRPLSDLPPLWASALPIGLPVFLIAQRAAWDAVVPRTAEVPPGFPLDFFVEEGWEIPAQFVDFFGDPTVAVLCGTLCALGLLWRRTVPAERAEIVGAAVAEGGGILLVAAAGGAFGAALRQSGLGGLIAELPAFGGFGTLLTAWFVAAAMRTAQGSATVAMVVAAGVVGDAAAIGAVHPVWVACAIGCGSKAVAWMNASGFWVFCKAGGLTERETLATFAPLTAVLSVAGLLATLLGAWAWPEF